MSGIRIDDNHAQEMLGQNLKSFLMALSERGIEDLIVKSIGLGTLKPLD